MPQDRVAAAEPKSIGFVQVGLVGQQTSKKPHKNATALLDPWVACWAKQWAMVQEKSEEYHTWERQYV